MQSDHAAKYGTQLLTSLGIDQNINTLCDHPVVSWHKSGLANITGGVLPLPLIAHADGALLALKTLAPHADLPISGALLMGERARLREIQCEGRQTAGGNGKLLETSDGLIALNLVREDDWDLIPAWLEDDVQDWSRIASHVRGRLSRELVRRGAEMGLALSKSELVPMPEHWFSLRRYQSGLPKAGPLIVDLSGLWAGPLASSLLMRCGATVIKVEGPERPDGMRLGHAGFYNLINAGKDCVALDFKDEKDLMRLRDLLERADIVIEASRPRALKQLGIDASDFVSRKPGKIWARMTAYGQKANHIGFGDDIGVAAGLSEVMQQTYGKACFVGDAVADPVSGLHLALAIYGLYQQGGGVVIDISMQDVLRRAMGEIDLSALKSRSDRWNALLQESDYEFYPMREVVDEAKALGADTHRLC